MFSKCPIWIVDCHDFGLDDYCHRMIRTLVDIMYHVHPHRPLQNVPYVLLVHAGIAQVLMSSFPLLQSRELSLAKE